MKDIEENIINVEESDNSLTENITDSVVDDSSINTNIRDLIKSFKPLDYFDFVNLHIHSKYSDGKAEFEDIIKQAKELGYQKIAICDHNTIEGHKKYQDNILIPAVEFDCWCGYVFLHLIAYGIDINNNILDKFMAKIKKKQNRIWYVFLRREI